MLLLYRLLVNLTLLFSPFIIFIRLLNRKEHPKRFLEKYGIESKNRATGKLIWFHGSSVGEILSVIPLIEKLEKNKNISQILLTSNTLSSSKVFKNFKLKKTIHQFFPIDSSLIVNKFLNYWKPSLVVFVESEIWPNMILKISKKKIPLILINARITKKTFKKWDKISSFSKNIFEKFDLCLSQNDETNVFLKNLGVRKIEKVGNLKFSESSLKINKSLDYNTKKFLKSKKILIAGVSTHKSEEIFCAKVFEKLKVSIKNGILLIIPRHIDRSTEIAKEMKNFGLNVHLHSSKTKILNDTNVYLVDTFGETKLFLRHCNWVFMGGSLINHGGQNPLEPARLGCKIIHGPFIDNFKEVYALMKNSKISYEIKNINKANEYILRQLKKNVNSKKNIKIINSLGYEILNNNQKELSKYI